MSLRTAIHVPDRRRLHALAGVHDLRRSELLWLGDLPNFDRLYFGVEFCQHLLPGSADVRAAAAFCRERGLGLTLLTPYGTDDLLPRIARLAEAAAAGPDPEVLVNDWGVLQQFLDRPTAVRPVLGRLLNRMMRDPRVPDVAPEHIGGDPAPISWRQSSAGSSTFRALLDRLGVERVESDVPLQGLLPLPAGGPKVSAWLPFGMVASGRICLTHALGRPAHERFVPPQTCDGPCRRFEASLRAPWPSRATTPVDGLEAPHQTGSGPPHLLLKGNTHFYRLQGPGLSAALAWARTSPPVDRIVACPDVPM